MANCILRTVTHIVQGNHCPIFLLIIGYSQGQQRSAKKQEILAAEKSTIQLARAADVPGVRDAAWCGASTAKIWQLVSQQQPKHSVGPVSDSKSTEDFEFWTWFEPCFLLLQLELHVSTLAVAANEEVAESNARMTSLAGYSGLSSMTLWILWICIFSLGWRNPWCQFPASGSSLWTIPYLSGRWVYTFLFFGVIHRYRWHIWQFGMDYASWQLNIFQKMRPFKSYLPSVTLHPMQTNLSLWTLALRGQAMPRPSSAVLVPLILMEVPFLWIASCRSFVSSLLPPDSEEGHGGTTSPTSSS